MATLSPAMHPLSSFSKLSTPPHQAAHSFSGRICILSLPLLIQLSHSSTSHQISIPIHLSNESPIRHRYGRSPVGRSPNESCRSRPWTKRSSVCCSRDTEEDADAEAVCVEHSCWPFGWLIFGETLTVDFWGGALN